MKLLNRRACNDVVKLHVETERTCLCGRSRGQHTSGGVTASYSGPARLMGMMSLDYLRAAPGGRYPWFLLPEPDPKETPPEPFTVDPRPPNPSRAELETLVGQAAQEIVEHEDGISLPFEPLPELIRGCAAPEATARIRVLVSGSGR